MVRKFSIFRGSCYHLVVEKLQMRSVNIAIMMLKFFQTFKMVVEILPLENGKLPFIPLHKCFREIIIIILLNNVLQCSFSRNVTS